MLCFAPCILHYVQTIQPVADAMTYGLSENGLGLWPSIGQDFLLAKRTKGRQDSEKTVQTRRQIAVYAVGSFVGKAVILIDLGEMVLNLEEFDHDVELKL